uniref:Uncharacterized protein n=1 Tax=Alexandrium monilatum TaxID=311494 RepID=A0A7S4W2G3_9DINO
MFGSCMDTLRCGFCAAKDMADTGVHIAGEKAAAVRTEAGKKSLKQLQKALEGSKSRVHEKPDVDITIQKVEFQDGMEVDIFNFSLSGLKCRVRMDVVGTAAQLAAMVAADAAKGAMKKISKAIGMGESLAQGMGGLRDAVHASAAEGTEVKSVEFDANLDLGVRKAGEEVSTAVSIVGDALDEVDKIIPVKTAAKYVEKAIGDKVKEIITTWAKDQVKSRIGVDVDETRAMATGALERLGLR